MPTEYGISPLETTNQDIEGEDIELMVEASEQLRNESTAEDVARLLELLRHPDFVVREAAAWPLEEIGGPKYLPQLFDAYQMGFEEGYDNDGFTTALVELVELHKVEARRVLTELLASPNPLHQKNATCSQNSANVFSPETEPP